MNRIERYFTPLRWFAPLVLAAFVAGCGGSGGNGGGTGTLGVSLTDAPACGFDAVNVTVVKARVHQSGSASESAGGWSEITLDPPRKINLLDLTNGVAESLGQTTLPAGHYTQVRLVLEANNANNGSNPPNNSVVLSGTGEEIALFTPSAVQSGIKLINEFDVAPGQRVDLMLDFDACKSVVTRGNGSYLLKPVIKVIPMTLNGINGFVDASLSNVMVSAQTGGTVVRSTVPDTSTGEFLLARLAPGNYDVVITADGHATAIIGTVPVAHSSSITMVSDAVTPISLPDSTTQDISGIAELNPPNADEVIFVAAKHTSGGAQVTVKSQAADLDSGAYTLTLPVGAPLFAQYGAGTLSPQDALAGKYTVEASANGYQTQSFSLNISPGDVGQNFTLTP